MQFSDAIQRMNAFGAEGRPFFFLFDFAMKAPLVCPLDGVSAEGIRFQMPGRSEVTLTEASTIDRGAATSPLLQRLAPYPFEDYARQYRRMMDALHRGDTYLVNLTCQTPINLTVNLEELYERGRAPYKLKYKNRFVCFSPETFVRIHKGVIQTCPMKGTIDASLPDARERLLSDVKETAEHSTVVDLLRNDLSRVATQVTVERFRYLDDITTDRGRLLQMSSLITGVLPTDYQAHLGDVLAALLPAGSVTGASKDSTVALIREVETYDRGYYTGVFGVFDGQDLDSAVLIRFVERTPKGWVYKSGGGLTAMSRLEAEYEEMQLKIYVPVS